MLCGIFKNIVFFNLIVFFFFFQTATKLLGQIVIKLFEPNYLINGSVRYFFWPRGAIKKLLRHYGRREPRKFGNRWYRSFTSFWPVRFSGGRLRASHLHSGSDSGLTDATQKNTLSLPLAPPASSSTFSTGQELTNDLYVKVKVKLSLSTPRRYKGE